MGYERVYLQRLAWQTDRVTPATMHTNLSCSLSRQSCIWYIHTCVCFTVTFDYHRLWLISWLVGITIVQVYVQHLLTQKGDEVYVDLFKNGGHLYVSPGLMLTYSLIVDSPLISHSIFPLPVTLDLLIHPAIRSAAGCLWAATCSM